MTNRIKKFDRATLNRIKPEVEGAITDAIENLGYGFTVDFGGGSFDDNSFKPKVTIVIDGADLDRDEFEHYASLFRLSADDFGKEFSNGGRKFRLVGLKPNRPKWPVVGECIADGKRYKFKEAALKGFQTPRETQ